MSAPISAMFGAAQCTTCGEEVIFEPCQRCGSYWSREPLITPATMSDGAVFHGLYDVTTAYHEQFRDLTLGQVYSLAGQRGWVVKLPQ